MTELTAICRAWLSAAKAGEPIWLATLTRVEGSSYRRPGARVLFSREAVLAGAVSGGCLERELVRTAPWLTRHGPVLRAIDPRRDEAAPSAAAGCFGRLEFLVEPLTPRTDAALGLLGSELEAERRVALVTVTASDLPNIRLGARVLKSGQAESSHVPDEVLARTLTKAAAEALVATNFRPLSLQIDGCTALVEVIEPPPHLFLFGAGADALPLAHIATLLGWNVTVCAGTPRPAIRDRFLEFARLSERSLVENVADLTRCARPLAVVMSHDYRLDRAALAELIGAPLRYLGVLGPRRRTARLLAELEAERGALGAPRKQRIFAPAGLALGAETPEEIALSIVAEAQAALAAMPHGSLRASPGKIHDALALDLHGELV
jgi:xanthine/CO dehydrogenase XdhC/CoxF family maturation factor